MTSHPSVVRALQNKAPSFPFLTTNPHHLRQFHTHTHRGTDLCQRWPKHSHFGKKINNFLSLWTSLIVPRMYSTDQPLTHLLPAIVSWLLHGANSVPVHFSVCCINTEAEKAQDPVRGSPRGCKETLQWESKNSDKNTQHIFILVPCWTVCSVTLSDSPRCPRANGGVEMEMWECTRALLVWWEVCNCDYLSSDDISAVLRGSNLKINRWL